MKTIDIIKINVVILFTLAFLVLLTVFTIQYFYWYNQAEAGFTSEAIKNYVKALRNLRITIYVYTITQGMRFELWWILKKHSKKKQG